MKIMVPKIEHIKNENDCTGCEGLEFEQGYSNNGSCQCRFSRDPGGSFCDCSFDDLYDRDSKKNKWRCTYLGVRLNTGIKPKRHNKCIMYAESASGL